MLLDSSSRRAAPDSENIGLYTQFDQRCLSSHGLPSVVICRTTTSISRVFELAVDGLFATARSRQFDYSTPTRRPLKPVCPSLPTSRPRLGCLPFDRPYSAIKRVSLVFTSGVNAAIALAVKFQVFQTVFVR